MKKIAVLVCILWMGFIFHMSSNTGVISNNQSHKVSQFIEKRSTKIDSEIKHNKINFTELNYIVRKNAHAFEYIFLAIFVGSALCAYNLKGKGAIICILFICLFYAVTDEFHQMFVPGRSSMVSDVLIDFLGSIIGMGIYYLLYYKVYLKHKS